MFLRGRLAVLYGVGLYRVRSPPPVRLPTAVVRQGTGQNGDRRSLSLLAKTPVTINYAAPGSQGKLERAKIRYDDRCARRSRWTRSCGA